MSWEATSERARRALVRVEAEGADDAAQHLGDEELAQQLRRPLVADGGPEQRQRRPAARARPRRAAAMRTTAAPSCVAVGRQHLGQQLVGVGRRLDGGQEQLVLAAEVVVHQRRVDAGAPSRCRGSSRRRTRARRTPSGRRPGPPPGCRGCRDAGPTGRLGHGAQLVLLRRVAAARARASRAAPATTATSSHIVPVAVGGPPDLLQRLDGVGQRQDGADRLQPAGHLVDRHEQPAEEELRQHDHRHELHRLELGAGEGAGQQPEGDAEHRVDDGDEDDEARPTRPRPGRRPSSRR